MAVHDCELCPCSTPGETHCPCLHETAPEPRDDVAVAEVARTLRAVGFWGTHGDRWNDSAWQDGYWATLAEALAPLIAERVRAAAERGWDEGYTQGYENGALQVRAGNGANPYHPIRADRRAERHV